MLFDLLPPALAGLILESLKQTATMVVVAALLSTLIGLPLGILLVATEPGHILERPVFQQGDRNESSTLSARRRSSS